MTFAVTTTTIIAEIIAVWVSFVQYKVCFCTDEKRENIIVYIIKLDTIYLHIKETQPKPSILVKLVLNLDIYIYLFYSYLKITYKAVKY